MQRDQAIRDLYRRALEALQARDERQAKRLAVELHCRGARAEAEEVQEIVWTRAEDAANRALRPLPERLRLAAAAMLLALDAVDAATPGHEARAWELVGDAAYALQEALGREEEA